MSIYQEAYEFFNAPENVHKQSVEIMAIFAEQRVTAERARIRAGIEDRRQGYDRGANYFWNRALDAALAVVNERD